MDGCSTLILGFMLLALGHGIWKGSAWFATWYPEHRKRAQRDRLMKEAQARYKPQPELTQEDLAAKAQQEYERQLQMIDKLPIEEKEKASARRHALRLLKWKLRHILGSLPGEE